MKESQKILIEVYPEYENIIKSLCNGELDDIKGECTDRIRNGDIVRCSRGICAVEIQGYGGSYRYVNGKYRNMAMGNKGYLRSLETGIAIRSEWGYMRVIKKAEDYD